MGKGCETRNYATETEMGLLSLQAQSGQKQPDDFDEIFFYF